MNNKKIKRSKTNTNAIAIKKTKGKNIFTIILFMIASIIVLLILHFGSELVDVGAEALKGNFDKVFANERELTYKMFYDKYFNKAEQKYHVANRISLSIGDLREKADLEVLSVSDVEYIIEDEKNNSKGINAWLEVPGHGEYVVDMQTAEFVIDEGREYVLVRVPKPELRNISIDYKNVKKLLFKNNLFDESYKVGEDLARQMLGTADLLIKKEFASNQYFYKSAENAARDTIICLVKRFNPDHPDLIAEVEFY